MSRGCLTVGTKTAKDLPVGSDVHGRSLTWNKVAENAWVDDDGDRFSDIQIDVLLRSGGQITFVSSGRGRSER
jgi:hypothetical protein